MPKFTDRLKHAWNAFTNKDPTARYDLGMSSSLRPDRIRLSRGNEKTIVTAVYNRIAIDVASVDIKHVKLDDNDRYIETIDSGLNCCLTIEANIDQTHRAFIQDVVMSMFDEGFVAAVPVDTTDNPNITGAFDVNTLRTGKIVEWYPRHIQARVYNDRTGQREEIALPKDRTAIIENPFYAVMNEPNSTVNRLNRKLALLDMVDEQSSSGKLNMIIQLPFAVKNEARQLQAEKRRKAVEEQLASSKYGVAYIDATEKITQINRALENNLLNQIEYLQKLLYSQLGLTEEILNGSADEKTMLNYNNRTIEPIVSAIVDEMKRKFLTKTARSRKQSLLFFRNPFKLTPIADLAELGDKFTRNEIMSSNEFRQVIGLKPIDDPRADELRNKNLNASEGQEFATVGSDKPTEDVPYEEVTDA